MTTILAAFAAGAIIGAVTTALTWQRRGNAEADAYWDRYIEAERERAMLQRDLARLNGEREIAAAQIVALSAVAQAATQQAQAGHGYCVGESVLDRLCRN